MLRGLHMFGVFFNGCSSRGHMLTFNRDVQVLVVRLLTVGEAALPAPCIRTGYRIQFDQTGPLRVCASIWLGPLDFGLWVGTVNLTVERCLAALLENMGGVGPDWKRRRGGTNKESGFSFVLEFMIIKGHNVTEGRQCNYDCTALSDPIVDLSVVFLIFVPNFNVQSVFQYFQLLAIEFPGFLRLPEITRSVISRWFPSATHLNCPASALSTLRISRLGSLNSDLLARSLLPDAECNVVQLAASSKTVHYYVVAVLSTFHTFHRIAFWKNYAGDHFSSATPRPALRESLDPTFQGDSLS